MHNQIIETAGLTVDGTESYPAHNFDLGLPLNLHEFPLELQEYLLEQWIASLDQDLMIQVAKTFSLPADFMSQSGMGAGSMMMDQCGNIFEVQLLEEVPTEELPDENPAPQDGSSAQPDPEVSDSTTYNAPPMRVDNTQGTGEETGIGQVQTSGTVAPSSNQFDPRIGNFSDGVAPDAIWGELSGSWFMHHIDPKDLGSLFSGIIELVQEFVLSQRQTDPSPGGERNFDDFPEEDAPDVEVFTLPQNSVIAVPDEVSITEDDDIPNEGLTFNIIDNDIDPEGDNIQVTEVKDNFTIMAPDVLELEFEQLPAGPGEVAKYQLTSISGSAVLIIQPDGEVFLTQIVGAPFQPLAEGEVIKISFGYVVEDDRGAMDMTDVTINITGNNDVVAEDDSIFIGQDDQITSTMNILNIKDNDFDPEGDDFEVVSVEDDFDIAAPLDLGLTFMDLPIDEMAGEVKKVQIDTNDGQAILTVFEDGEVTLVHTSGMPFVALDDEETIDITFTYTIEDIPGGVTDTAEVLIGINGQNDLLAEDDMIQIGQDEEITTSINVFETLANDVDPEGDGFEIVGIDNNFDIQAPVSLGLNFMDLAPDGGAGEIKKVQIDTNDGQAVLTIFDDGTVTLIHTAGTPFIALDDDELVEITYTYNTEDDRGATANADVLIGINGQNDLLAADDMIQIGQDEEITTSINIFETLANDVDPEGHGFEIVSVDNDLDIQAPASLGLTFMDLVPDGGAGEIKKVQIDTNDGQAVLTVFDDGTVTLIHTAGTPFIALDDTELVEITYTYNTQDDFGATANADVLIGINGQNDLLAEDDMILIGQDEEITTSINVFETLANDVDPEGHGFEIVSVDNDLDIQAPGDLGLTFVDLVPDGGAGEIKKVQIDTNDGQAILTVFNDGTVTLLHAAGTPFIALEEGETVEITYTYNTEDDFGATASADVLIGINGQNDLIAIDDEICIDQDEEITGEGTVFNLLLNDFDPENDAFELTEVKDDFDILAPQHLGLTFIEVAAGPGEVRKFEINTNDGQATLSVASDGTVTLVHTSEQSPFASLTEDEMIGITFGYSIVDDLEAMDMAVAAIKIQGQNDAPEICDFEICLQEAMDSMKGELYRVDLDDVLKDPDNGDEHVFKILIDGEYVELEAGMKVKSADGLAKLIVKNDNEIVIKLTNKGEKHYDGLQEGEMAMSMDGQWSIQVMDSGGLTDVFDPPYKVKGQNDSPKLEDFEICLTEAMDNMKGDKFSIDLDSVLSDPDINDEHTFKIEINGEFVEMEPGMKVLSEDGHAKLIVKNGNKIVVKLTKSGEEYYNYLNEHEMIESLAGQWAIQVMDSGGKTDTINPTYKVKGANDSPELCEFTACLVEAMDDMKGDPYKIDLDDLVKDPDAHDEHTFKIKIDGEFVDLQPGMKVLSEDGLAKLIVKNGNKIVIKLTKEGEEHYNHLNDGELGGNYAGQWSIQVMDKGGKSDTIEPNYIVKGTNDSPKLDDFEACLKEAMDDMKGDRYHIDLDGLLSDPDANDSHTFQIKIDGEFVDLQPGQKVLSEDGFAKLIVKADNKIVIKLTKAGEEHYNYLNENEMSDLADNQFWIQVTDAGGKTDMIDPGYKVKGTNDSPELCNFEACLVEAMDNMPGAPDMVDLDDLVKDPDANDDHTFQIKINGQFVEMEPGLSVLSKDGYAKLFVGEDNKIFMKLTNAGENYYNHLPEGEVVDAIGSQWWIQVTDLGGKTDRIDPTYKVEGQNDSPKMHNFKACLKEAMDDMPGDPYMVDLDNLVKDPDDGDTYDFTIKKDGGFVDLTEGLVVVSKDGYAMLTVGADNKISISLTAVGEEYYDHLPEGKVIHPKGGQWWIRVTDEGGKRDQIDPRYKVEGTNDSPELCDFEACLVEAMDDMAGEGYRIDLDDLVKDPDHGDTHTFKIKIDGEFEDFEEGMSVLSKDGLAKLIVKEGNQILIKLTPEGEEHYNYLPEGEVVDSYGDQWWIQVVDAGGKTDMIDPGYKVKGQNDSPELCNFEACLKEAMNHMAGEPDVIDLKDLVKDPDAGDTHTFKIKIDGQFVEMAAGLSVLSKDGYAKLHVGEDYEVTIKLTQAGEEYYNHLPEGEIADSVGGQWWIQVKDAGGKTDQIDPRYKVEGTNDSPEITKFKACLKEAMDDMPGDPYMVDLDDLTTDPDDGDTVTFKIKTSDGFKDLEEGMQVVSKDGYAVLTVGEGNKISISLTEAGEDYYNHLPEGKVVHSKGGQWWIRGFDEGGKRDQIDPRYKVEGTNDSPELCDFEACLVEAMDNMKGDPYKIDLDDLVKDPDHGDTHTFQIKVDGEFVEFEEGLTVVSKDGYAKLVVKEGNVVAIHLTDAGEEYYDHLNHGDIAESIGGQWYIQVTDSGGKTDVIDPTYKVKGQNDTPEFCDFDACLVEAMDHMKGDPYKVDLDDLVKDSDAYDQHTFQIKVDDEFIELTNGMTVLSDDGLAMLTVEDGNKIVIKLTNAGEDHYNYLPEGQIAESIGAQWWIQVTDKGGKSDLIDPTYKVKGQNDSPEACNFKACLKEAMDGMAGEPFMVDLDSLVKDPDEGDTHTFTIKKGGEFIELTEGLVVVSKDGYAKLTVGEDNKVSIMLTALGESYYNHLPEGKVVDSIGGQWWIRVTDEGGKTDQIDPRYKVEGTNDSPDLCSFKACLKEAMDGMAGDSYMVNLDDLVKDPDHGDTHTFTIKVDGAFVELEQGMEILSKDGYAVLSVGEGNKISISLTDAGEAYYNHLPEGKVIHTNGGQWWIRVTDEGGKTDQIDPRYKVEGTNDSPHLQSFDACVKEAMDDMAGGAYMIDLDTLLSDPDHGDTHTFKLRVDGQFEEFEPGLSVLSADGYAKLIVGEDNKITIKLTPEGEAHYNHLNEHEMSDLVDNQFWIQVMDAGGKSDLIDPGYKVKGTNDSPEMEDFEACLIESMGNMPGAPDMVDLDDLVSDPDTNDEYSFQIKVDGQFVDFDEGLSVKSVDGYAVMTMGAGNKVIIKLTAAGEAYYNHLGDGEMSDSHDNQWWIQVTDKGGKTDLIDPAYKVKGQNDAPKIDNFKACLKEAMDHMAGEPYMVDLDDLVSDADMGDSYDFTIKVDGEFVDLTEGMEVLSKDGYAKISVGEGNKLSIMLTAAGEAYYNHLPEGKVVQSDPSQWWIRVTDEGGKHDQIDPRYKVEGTNDSPEMHNFKACLKEAMDHMAGEPYMVDLDDLVSDPDHDDSYGFTIKVDGAFVELEQGMEILSKDGYAVLSVGEGNKISISLTDAGEAYYNHLPEGKVVHTNGGQWWIRVTDEGGKTDQIDPRYKVEGTNDSPHLQSFDACVKEAMDDMAGGMHMVDLDTLLSDPDHGDTHTFKLRVDGQFEEFEPGLSVLSADGYAKLIVGEDNKITIKLTPEGEAHYNHLNEHEMSDLVDNQFWIQVMDAGGKTDLIDPGYKVKGTNDSPEMEDFEACLIESMGNMPGAPDMVDLDDLVSDPDTNDEYSFQIKVDGQFVDFDEGLSVKSVDGYAVMTMGAGNKVIIKLTAAGEAYYNHLGDGEMSDSHDNQWWIHVVDKGGKTDLIDPAYKVKGQNDAPKIDNFKACLKEAMDHMPGDPYMVDLDDLVSDSDMGDSYDFTIKVDGEFVDLTEGMEVLSKDGYAKISVGEGNKLSIMLTAAGEAYYNHLPEGKVVQSDPSQWWIRVTDEGGKHDQIDPRYKVEGTNDSPEMHNFKACLKEAMDHMAGEPYMVDLDDLVSDPDHDDSYGFTIKVDGAFVDLTEGMEVLSKDGYAKLTVGEGNKLSIMLTAAGEAYYNHLPEGKVVQSDPSQWWIRVTDEGGKHDQIDPRYKVEGTNDSPEMHNFKACLKEAANGEPGPAYMIDLDDLVSDPDHGDTHTYKIKVDGQFMDLVEGTEVLSKDGYALLSMGEGNKVSITLTESGEAYYNHLNDGEEAHSNSGQWWIQAIDANGKTDQIDPRYKVEGTSDNLPPTIMADQEVCISKDEIDFAFNLPAGAEELLASIEEAEMIPGYPESVNGLGGIHLQHEHPVKITFNEEGAGFNNAMGWYTIDENGNIENVQMIWTDTDSLNSGDMAFLNLPGQNPGDPLPAGTTIGFFLIPDGADQNNWNNLQDGTFKFVDPDTHQDATIMTDSPKLIYEPNGGGSDVTIMSEYGEEGIWHSAARVDDDSIGLNSDGLQHVFSRVSANGSALIGFEDLEGVEDSDLDFNDITFFADIGPANAIAVNNFADVKVDDPEDNEIVSAMVKLEEEASMDDVLILHPAFMLPAGVVVNGSGTNMITIVGAASELEYSQIMSSILLQPGTDGDGEYITGIRKISFKATDEEGATSEPHVISVEVAEKDMDDDVQQHVVENNDGQDDYEGEPWGEADEFGFKEFGPEISDDLHVKEGNDGDNTLKGSSSKDDYLVGKDGDDKLIGRDGDDLLLGGKGNDTLNGSGGNDVLVGGEGKDTLKGGSGDDHMVFDEDDALIDGGSGYDTVHFLEVGDVDLSGVKFVKNIEELDLSRKEGTDTSLKLSVDDVVHMTDGDNHLRIDGDEHDSVDIGDGWVADGPADDDGFITYHHNDGVDILIHQDIKVQYDEG